MNSSTAVSGRGVHEAVDGSSYNVRSFVLLSLFSDDVGCFSDDVALALFGRRRLLLGRRRLLLVRESRSPRASGCRSGRVGVDAGVDVGMNVHSNCSAIQVSQASQVSQATPILA